MLSDGLQQAVTALAQPAAVRDISMAATILAVARGMHQWLPAVPDAWLLHLGCC